MTRDVLGRLVGQKDIHTQPSIKLLLHGSLNTENKFRNDKTYLNNINIIKETF